MLKTIMDLVGEIIGWTIELIKNLWLTDKFLTIYIALAILIGNAYETKLNLYWLCVFSLLAIFGWHSYKNRQQPLYILDDYIDLFNRVSNRTRKDRTNNNITGYIAPPRLGNTSQPPTEPVQPPIQNNQNVQPIQNQRVNIVNKPIGRIFVNRDSEKESIINLEQMLKSDILAQDQAVECVIKGLKRKLAGTEANKNAPLTFLLTGPTGTGKTQLVKLVADGLNRKFDRYDMGNYKNEATLWQLLGSPQGYTGDAGKLTQFAKANPKGVILFDEIEKGCNQMYDFMLALIDEGTVKDNKTNEIIRFNETMVFFTTNLVTDVPEAARENAEVMRDSILATGFLRPELVARIRNIVPFYQFTDEDIIIVVEVQIGKYLDNICKTKNCESACSYEVIEFIASTVDKKYGARNVSQQIEKLIGNEFTEALFAWGNKRISLIKIGLEGKKITVNLEG